MEVRNQREDEESDIQHRNVGNSEETGIHLQGNSVGRDITAAMETGCESQDPNQTFPLTCAQRSHTGRLSQVDSGSQETPADADHSVDTHHRRMPYPPPANATLSQPNDYDIHTQVDPLLVHDGQIGHSQYMPSGSHPLTSGLQDRLWHSKQKTRIFQSSIPVQNDTLHSMGTRSVILVKILPGEKYTTKDVLTNPLLLNKTIYNSIFGKSLTIKDIRLNIRRSLVAIENSTPLPDDLTTALLSKTTLGQFNVHCYLPNSDIQRCGVISNISTNTDLTELLQDAKCQNNVKIVGLDRMKRRNQVTNTWEDSTSVKITFESLVVPDVITIHYVRYRVRPYVSTPMQCYNCQRLGHTAKSCSSKNPRCMLCGGPHTKEDCSAQQRRCANCHGDHGANSSRCPQLQQAIAIEKHKAINKVDHHTARQAILHESPSQPGRTSTNKRQLVQQAPNSYAEAASRNFSATKVLNTVTSKTYDDASTQTETVTKSTTPAITNNDFFSKLRDVLLIVLQLNISKESKHAQRKLTENAIKNSFGVDITTDPAIMNPPHEDHPINTPSSKKRSRPANSSIDTDSSTAAADVISGSDCLSSDSTNYMDTIEGTQERRLTRSLTSGLPAAASRKKKKKQSRKDTTGIAAD